MLLCLPGVLEAASNVKNEIQWRVFLLPISSFFLLWFSYVFKKASPVAAFSILFVFYDYFLEIQMNKVMSISKGQHRASKAHRKTMYIFING